MKRLTTFMLCLSLSSCVNLNEEEYNDAVAKVKFWETPSEKYTVTVTNVSSGSYLTPILAVGHSDQLSSMFTYGKAASSDLQAAAEGGDTEQLASQFKAAGGEVVNNPAGDLLGPHEYTEFKLSKNNTRISLIAKILPTNDGFVALDNANLRIGSQYLYAIDAGTEGNDEKITGGGRPNTPGIPADPSQTADLSASGIAGVQAEGSVERHPGILGGEGSALDPEIHGWDGPIALVEVSM